MEFRGIRKGNYMKAQKISKTEIEFDINEIAIKILGNKYVDWDKELIADVYKLIKTYPRLKK